MTHADESLEKAADAIRAARALFVGAGAGFGVDSGLPDFRGDQGFWKAYPPLGKLGVGFAEMANPRWFQHDPGLAWGFYGHRLNLYRKTVPHAGFELLRRWGEATPGGVFVFTSNVDGQFQAAGFRDNIVECHGSIHHIQCAGCCGQAIWKADDVEVEVDEETFRATEPFPNCPYCGNIARPNILMFGDWSWIPERSHRQQEKCQSWLLSNASRKLVVIECGAGSAVPTVRWQCEQAAREHSATLIRINPREPHGPSGTISLAMGALDALQGIEQRL